MLEAELVAFGVCEYDPPRNMVSVVCDERRSQSDDPDDFVVTAGARLNVDVHTVLARLRLGHPLEEEAGAPGAECAQGLEVVGKVCRARRNPEDLAPPAGKAIRIGTVDRDAANGQWQDGSQENASIPAVVRGAQANEAPTAKHARSCRGIFEHPLSLVLRRPTLSRSRLLLGYFGSDAIADERCDLAGSGMATEGRLRVDEVTVERHLEASPRGGHKFDRRDQWCPALQQLVRQTDGLRYVVSGDAELDRQPMTWVQHRVLLSARSLGSHRRGSRGLARSTQVGQSAAVGGSSLRVARDVEDALTSGAPVVALESTLFAHGIPRPRNLEVARELEALVRAAGVTPATVGVLEGTPVVGLTVDEIQLLATEDVAKASTRDLPLVAARGVDAATTVAATSWLAHRAGVRVFATGGLGGVHRGATLTFDESADLPALGRTPVTVVCAGVKSILDIAATLERLETLGVSVAGYRTDRFPGFLVADSGFPISWTLDGPDEVAAAMRIRDELSIGAALVIANPIPVHEQMDPAWHDQLLARALEAAEEAHVHGQEVTPFLLDHMQRASGGATLEANVAAVRNNVLVAAAIARAAAST